MSQRQEDRIPVEINTVSNNNEEPIAVLEQVNTEQQVQQAPVTEINNNNMMMIDNEMVEILVETWTN